jgi:2-polyprenyl-3-methyl-5-hydroxy-6-metoxy-1,4-benzoquinol methylase
MTWEQGTAGEKTGQIASDRASGQSSAEEGAASWEEIADGWAERVRTKTDWARPVLLDKPHLDLLGDVAGKRVLDAGCGEGRFARMLAERGAKVTAIDLSENMIRHAKEQESEAPLGIEYSVKDMCDLSAFQDSQFELVVAYLSIIDVEDYEAAFGEIARTLEPGGQFVYSLVHPCFSPPVWGWEPRKPGTIPLRDHDRLFRKVDNYFPAAEIRFKMWPTAPAETINYHRPLTEYAHTGRSVGLVIRDIVEPTPDPKLAEQFDYLKGEFRAPTFMILDCVKTRV